MKETSKITYDFGKLKRFMTVVRLMMQDTILSLVLKNYQKFEVFVRNYVPDEVRIVDAFNIKNNFLNEDKKLERAQKWDLSYESKTRVPIFTLEMLKT